MSNSEDMIKLQVIASLHNISHQSRILSKIITLPTLNGLIECLLTLESTAKSYEPRSTIASHDQYESISFIMTMSTQTPL